MCIIVVEVKLKQRQNKNINNTLNVKFWQPYPSYVHKSAVGVKNKCMM